VRHQPDNELVLGRTVSDCRCLSGGARNRPGLADHGAADAARRITDSIEGGSTSSEILFGLRWEFDQLLADEIRTPQELKTRIANLRAEIEETLA
jgi:hypothetical protein